MNSYCLIILAVALLIIYAEYRKKRKNAAVVNHRLKHNNKEGLKVKALAEKFIGKECLVYTITSETNSIKGTITEVSDSGLLIEYNGNLQAVNLEYITRIQEWPRNAKGKKKSIF